MGVAYHNGLAKLITELSIKEKILQIVLKERLVLSDARKGIVTEAGYQTI